LAYNRPHVNACIFAQFLRGDYNDFLQLQPALFFSRDLIQALIKDIKFVTKLQAIPSPYQAN
jgi:hypothetical protein